jgi:hypothetical protein
MNDIKQQLLKELGKLGDGADWDCSGRPDILPDFLSSALDRYARAVLEEVREDIVSLDRLVIDLTGVEDWKVAGA